MSKKPNKPENSDSGSEIRFSKDKKKESEDDDMGGEFPSDRSEEEFKFATPKRRRLVEDRFEEVDDFSQDQLEALEKALKDYNEEEQKVIEDSLEKFPYSARGIEDAEVQIFADNPSLPVLQVELQNLNRRPDYEVDIEDSASKYNKFLKGSMRKERAFNNGRVNITNYLYRLPKNKGDQDEGTKGRILEERTFRRINVPVKKDISPKDTISMTILLKSRYKNIPANSEVDIEVDTNLEDGSISMEHHSLSGEIPASFFREFDNLKGNLLIKELHQTQDFYDDLLRNFFDMGITLLHPSGYNLFKVIQVICWEEIEKTDHNYNRAHRDTNLLRYYPTKNKSDSSLLIENTAKVIASLTTVRGKYLDRIIRQRIGKNDYPLSGRPRRDPKGGTERLLQITFAYATHRKQYQRGLFNIVSNVFGEGSLENFDAFLGIHRMDPELEHDENSFLVDFIQSNLERDGVSIEAVYILFTIFNVFLCDVEIFKRGDENIVGNMMEEILDSCRNDRVAMYFPNNMFFKTKQSIQIFSHALLTVSVMCLRSITKNSSYQTLYGKSGYSSLNEQFLFFMNEQGELGQMLSDGQVLDGSLSYITEELNLSGLERDVYQETIAGKRRIKRGIEKNRNIHGVMIRTRKIPQHISKFWKSDEGFDKHILSDLLLRNQTELTRAKKFLKEIISSYLWKLITELERNGRGVAQLAFTPILQLSISDSKVRELVEFGSICVFWTSIPESNERMNIRTHEQIMRRIVVSNTFFDKKVERGLNFITQLIKIIETRGMTNIDEILINPDVDDPDGLVSDEYKDDIANDLLKLVTKFNSQNRDLLLVNHEDSDAIRVSGNTYRALTTKNFEIGGQVYATGNEEIGSGSFVSLSSFLTDLLESKLADHKYDLQSLEKLFGKDIKVHFRIEGIPFYNICANAFTSTYRVIKNLLTMGEREKTTYVRNLKAGEKLKLWESTEERYINAEWNFNPSNPNHQRIRDNHRILLRDNLAERYLFEENMNNRYYGHFREFVKKINLFSANTGMIKKQTHAQLQNTILISMRTETTIYNRMCFEYFNTTNIPCTFLTGWFISNFELYKVNNIKALFEKMTEYYKNHNTSLTQGQSKSLDEWKKLNNAFTVADIINPGYDMKKITKSFEIWNNELFGVPKPEHFSYFSRNLTTNLLTNSIETNERIYTEIEEEFEELKHKILIRAYNGILVCHCKPIYRRIAVSRVRCSCSLLPKWIDTKKDINFINIGATTQIDFAVAEEFGEIVTCTDTESEKITRINKSFIDKQINYPDDLFNSNISICLDLVHLATTHSQNFNSFLEWIQITFAMDYPNTYYFFFSDINMILVMDYFNNNFNYVLTSSTNFILDGTYDKLIKHYNYYVSVEKVYENIQILTAEIEKTGFSYWDSSERKEGKRQQLFKSPFIFEISCNHISIIDSISCFMEMYKTARNTTTFKEDFILAMSGHKGDIKDKEYRCKLKQKSLHIDSIEHTCDDIALKITENFMGSITDKDSISIKDRIILKSMLPKAFFQMRSDQFRLLQHLFFTWDIESYTHPTSKIQVPFIVTLCCYNHVDQKTCLNMDTSILSNYLDSICLYKKTFVGENCIRKFVEHIFINYLSVSGINENQLIFYSFNGSKYDHVLLIEYLMKLDTVIVGNGYNDLKAIEVTARENLKGYNNNLYEKKITTTPSVKFIDFLCLSPCGGLKNQCKNMILDPNLQKKGFPVDNLTREFLMSNIEEATEYCMRDSECLAGLVVIFRNSLNNIICTAALKQIEFVKNNLHLISNTDNTTDCLTKDGLFTEAQEYDSVATDNLMLFLQKMGREPSHKSFLSKESAAGIAFTLFREYFWRPTIYNNVTKKEGIVGDQGIFLEILRKFYQGGNCCNSIKHGKNLIGYDFVSCYPYIMTQSLPINPFTQHVVINQDLQIEDVCKFNYYEISYYRFPYLRQEIYPFPMRGSMKNTKLVGAFYPRTVKDTWLWGFEIIKIYRVIRRCYPHIVNPIEGMMCKTMFVNSESFGSSTPDYKKKHLHKPDSPHDNSVIMKDYVDHLFKLKNEYSKSTLSSERCQVPFIKVMLNSLYGKFGQRHYNNNVYGFNLDYVKDITNKHIKTQLYGTGPERGKVQKCELSNPRRGCGDLVRIASFITARARMRLWSFIMDIIRVGGRVFYWDTDSIITDIDLKLYEEFKDKIKKELGCLDEEKRVSEGFFVLPKFYTLVKKGHIMDLDLVDNIGDPKLDNMIYRSKGIHTKVMNLERIREILTTSKSTFFQTQFFRNCGSVKVVQETRKDISVKVMKRKFKDDSNFSEEFSEAFEDEEEYNNYLEEIFKT